MSPVEAAEKRSATSPALRIKISEKSAWSLVRAANIRALQESTQTQIEIEDDGTVTVIGLDKDAPSKPATASKP